MGAQPRSGRVLKALALAGAVLGAFFAGILTERLRFDFQRSDMLRRYDQALREHRQEIIQSEKHATEPTAEKTATR